MHLEIQITNGLHNALVGQGEGVEGAGEEGYPLLRFEAEISADDAVMYDETVDVGQGGRRVEEGQFFHTLLVDQEQNLFCQQHEQLRFLLVPQHLGGEDPLA